MNILPRLIFLLACCCSAALADVVAVPDATFPPAPLADPALLGLDPAALPAEAAAADIPAPAAEAAPAVVDDDPHAPRPAWGHSETGEGVQYSRFPLPLKR